MMKKNGFTLAEVLITLAIIGVVATMTLPTLMTNTTEAQAKTGLKKGINTLTEVAQMSKAVAGFDYADLLEWDGVTRTADEAEAQNIFGILASRASIDMAKEDFVKDSAYEAAQAIHFRDGSVLLLDASKATTTEDNAKYLDDGLPVGFVVEYDTNGAKGPNILSNCDAKALGVSEEATLSGEGASALKDANDFTACLTKSNRVIKDRFLIRLRGSVAQPEGPAANWVISGEGVKATTEGNGGQG